MAIQTATPEQIASCVVALKAHIDRVEAENRRLREALEQIMVIAETGADVTCDDDLMHVGRVARAALKGAAHE